MSRTYHCDICDKEITFGDLSMVHLALIKESGNSVKSTCSFDICNECLEKITSYTLFIALKNALNSEHGKEASL